jgi:hypothetical protein
MNYGFDPVFVHNAPQERLIADIALDERSPFDRPTVTGAEIIDHYRLKASLGQGLGCVATDVTGSSGYQNIPQIFVPPSGSLCRGDRAHLDRLGLSVQRARDRYFLSSELLRRLLVAQRVDFLAVIENIQRAVRLDARSGALGIGRSHSHSRMVGGSAHTVGNGARELSTALCGNRRSNYKKA